jgi:16S rRNA (guanine(966)-N(2))-methyltransferase RsmD
VRIISGFLKARRFSIPKSFPARPTTDFAKEGLFNVLEHQMSLYDLEILDLCAGTGNISFEFLSREASSVVAVDSNTNCLRYIQKNAIEFGISEQLETYKSDILAFLNRTDRKFDLIFADPPYEYKFHAEIARIVFERNLLKEDGLLIIEHGRHTHVKELPNFNLVRNYGNVYFSFFRSPNNFL